MMKFLKVIWQFCSYVFVPQGRPIPEVEEWCMDQEIRWLTRYNEVQAFIKTIHRNPSKYNPEDRLMIHFMKRNRKLINAGNLVHCEKSFF